MCLRVIKIEKDWMFHIMILDNWIEKQVAKKATNKVTKGASYLI